MGFYGIYPLVMTNIAMENHHFKICLMGNLTISMAIFNGYVKLPEDNPFDFPLRSCKLNPKLGHLGHLSGRQTM